MLSDCGHAVRLKAPGCPTFHVVVGPAGVGDLLEATRNHPASLVGPLSLYRVYKGPTIVGVRVGDHIIRCG